MNGPGKGDVADSLSPIPADPKWEGLFAPRIAAENRCRKWTSIVLPWAFLVIAGLGAKVALETPKEFPVQPPARVMNIPVRNPIELDGKSKQDIFQLRRDALKSLPDLSPLWPPPPAIETSPVWSDIASWKPWLGIQRQSNSSFEGASVESLFINNPALLAGLESTDDWTAGVVGAPTELTCKEVVVVENRRELRILYEVPKTSALHSRMKGGQATFLLNLINATDMGFRQYDLCWSGCRGFQFRGLKVQKTCSDFYAARPVKDGSQVNQLCKRDDELRLRIVSLPAVLTLNLWRNASELPTPTIEGPATAMTVVLGVVDQP